MSPIALSFVLLSFFNIFVINLYSAEVPGTGTKFSYDESTGRGPSRWAQLNTSWFLCGNGTRQSPIPIFGILAQTKPSLGCLNTTYLPAPATLINRGNDIEVEWNGNAGSLFIEGTSFKLLQTHWHTPAEHKLNGIRYAMEIHLVHESNAGQTAVIGILYKYGSPDPFLSTLYPKILSLRNGTREVDLETVDPRDIDDFHGKYYRYNGSFTSPPCTENVSWTILKKVKTVSLQQVQALKAAVDEGFEENARPIQPLNGRPVYKNAFWIF